MTRFCPSCGTELDEGVLFCPTCGRAVGDETGAKPGPDTPTAPAHKVRGGRSTDAPPAPAPGASAAPDWPRVTIPVTWPTTLTGWLIGAGSALAALGLLIGLFDTIFNPIDVLLLPAFAAVAATVFFVTKIPAIPYLATATLAVSLVGFGVGVDRIGFGVAGLGELLLFLGSAAAAIGGILLEVGQDVPVGGPRT